MKLVKEYLHDGSWITPNDEEIKECMEIANNEDCIVRLRWFVNYSGWYTLEVSKGMTFEECKSQLPTCYPV